MKILNRIFGWIKSFFIKEIPVRAEEARKQRDWPAFVKSFGLERMKPSARRATVEKILKSRRFFA